MDAPISTGFWFVRFVVFFTLLLLVLLQLDCRLMQTTTDLQKIIMLAFEWVGRRENEKNIGIKRVNGEKREIHL